MSDEEDSDSSKDESEEASEEVEEESIEGDDVMAMVEKMDAEDVEAKNEKQAQNGANDSNSWARSADALYGELLESRVLLQSICISLEKLNGPNASAAESMRQTVDAFLKLRSQTQGTKMPRGELWQCIDQGYEERREHWEASMEAWRKRTQLGAAVARLSAVNVGPFQSARNALNDIERTRKRRHPEASDGSLDLECYDDTPLYRTQLKEILESRPRRKKNSAHTFEAEVHDLAAAHLGHDKTPMRSSLPLSMGNFKKKKHHRESKGRTLKFETHDKIKHFMFPVPAPKPPVDVQLLFQSLFQS